MRFRTTLILLVIAAAVAAFFFLVEQPRHMRETERQEREQQLTTATPDDVHTVTISRPDITIALEREDDHWAMSEPTTDRAADGSVNTVVHTALRAEIAGRFAAEASDLPQYGLDEPAATVSFARESGDRILVIRIGNLTLRKTHCYALIDGAPDVLLLPAGLRRYVLRDLFEFRYKRVFDVPVEDVTRIEIASGTRFLTWERGDGESWSTVQDGDTILGDKIAVESIIRQLRGLRAKDIVFGEEEELTTTAGTISLSARADPAETTVTFGQRSDKGCYVRTTDNDRVVLIEPTMLHVFDKTVEDLRDRHLLSFDGEQTFRLMLETSEKTLTIVKAGAGWSFANPLFGVVDQGAVSDLLARIENLEFNRTIEEHLRSPGRFGFEKPIFGLTIFDAEDRIIDRLLVGKPLGDGTLRYVTSLSTNMLAGIEAGVIAGIEEDFQNLGAD